MTAKVTKDGLNIPKAWLGDAKEVEVRRERGAIVISLNAPGSEADPIFDLGKDPVEVDVIDASERHDHFL